MTEPKKKSHKGAKSAEPLTAPEKLKILITIVDRFKTDFYVDVLEGYNVNMQAVIYGIGTAPTEIMHYLGLSQPKKSVILSVVREDMIKDIMIAYEDKYFKTKNGKGIAFTIPISSVIGVSIYQFLSNHIPMKRSESI